MSAYAHKKSHQVFPCKICGEPITGANQLKTHELRAHPEIFDKKIPCPHCGKEFADETKHK